MRMKKRNTVLSLLTAALMLPVLPVGTASAAKVLDGWQLVDECYTPDGGRQYEGILNVSNKNELTIPTEVDGAPVKYVEPVEFIREWKSYNHEATELTVHVPEGVKIKERDYKKAPDDMYMLHNWDFPLTAKFILSDGTELVYAPHYNEYYDHAEEPIIKENGEIDYVRIPLKRYWDYEILTDENGEKYVNILKYNGISANIEIPKALEGLPVKSIDGKLLKVEQQRYHISFDIPYTVERVGDGFFDGIHTCTIVWSDSQYEYHGSDDPDIPPYLSLVKMYKRNRYRSFDEMVPEADEMRAEGKSESEIDYLYQVRAQEDYLENERREIQPAKSEIAGIPVMGAESVDSYIIDFDGALSLPDSIKFIRSNVFSNSVLSDLNLPQNVKILPSDFLDNNNRVRTKFDSFENVMWIPRDVFTDHPYNESEGLLPAEKMLPEGVSFDSPFDGFHISDDMNRTYRIYMDRSDFNYYAHLITDPTGEKDVPAEFMGFPVIDERSDAMYASAAYIKVPEDMRELSLNSFIFDPQDFPALKQGIKTADYKSYIDGVKNLLQSSRLKDLKVLDILSDDIHVAERVFYDTDIKELSFPKNAVIENNAFGSSKVENLTFEGENAEIKLNSFAFAQSDIKNLNFPKKVSDMTIGTNTFANIKADELTIPEGTSFIGTCAFADCKNLKNVVVNGSPEIDKMAFSNCSALENITFNGTPKLNSTALRNCRSLKNIDIDLSQDYAGELFDTCDSLETINGKAAFDKNGVPSAEVKDFIERTCGSTDNNILVDKYINYRLKQIIKETVTDDMTDIEKLKALHDKVCSMVSYDTGNEDDKKNHLDISVFLNEKSVCEGYARALNLLLNEAGIKSCYLQAPDHAWNIVELGGHYFHVDSTWDDGEKISYDWFLKSDDEVKPDPSHSTWEIFKPSPLHSSQISKVPKCDEKMGDVNGDGIVDGKDASAVLASYARASAGDEPTVDPVLSDFNFNGRTDAVDASAIISYYAKSSIE